MEINSEHKAYQWAYKVYDSDQNYKLRTDVKYDYFDYGID